MSVMRWGEFGEIAVRMIGQVKPGENLLILADTWTDMEIAEACLIAGINAKANAQLLVIPRMASTDIHAGLGYGHRTRRTAARQHYAWFPCCRRERAPHSGPRWRWRSQTYRFRTAIRARRRGVGLGPYKRVSPGHCGPPV